MTNKQIEEALNLPREKQNTSTEIANCNKEDKSLQIYKDILNDDGSTPENKIKKSLTKNKEDVYSLYKDTKDLLKILMKEAKESARARDVEVLSDYIKTTSGLLKQIEDIDSKMIDIDEKKAKLEIEQQKLNLQKIKESHFQNKDSGNSKKGTTYNQIIFSGDSRELSNLMKKLQNKESEVIENNE